MNTQQRSRLILTLGHLPPNGQRHDSLLRWATNLTQDCDVVEKRFKYFRPGNDEKVTEIAIEPLSADVIQSYDSNPPSYQHLQYENGNLRYPEVNKSSLVSRTSRRANPTSEQRVYRDRAAAKIQAAYRGYSVRKSLTCLNEKQKHLHSEFNQRVSDIAFLDHKEDEEFALLSLPIPKAKFTWRKPPSSQSDILPTQVRLDTLMNCSLRDSFAH